MDRGASMTCNMSVVVSEGWHLRAVCVHKAQRLYYAL